MRATIMTLNDKPLVLGEDNALVKSLFSLQVRWNLHRELLCFIISRDHRKDIKKGVVERQRLLWYNRKSILWHSKQ